MAIKKVKSESKCDKVGSNSQVELYYFENMKNDIYSEHMEYMKSDILKNYERNKIEARKAGLNNEYGYDTAQACNLLAMTIQGESTLFLAIMQRIIKLKQEKSKNIQ